MDGYRDSSMCFGFIFSPPKAIKTCVNNDQLCGLVTTQYTPESGTSYPLSTYMILLFQVFVSSVAGVYNQSLLKDGQASFHAQNAVLYGCGVIINGLVHLTLSYVTEDEPGFFVGYTNSAAYLVILSNVFIGLAITAVYKCKFDFQEFLGLRSCNNDVRNELS